MIQPIDWKKLASTFSINYDCRKFSLNTLTLREAYLAGVRAGIDAAAKVHDNIDPACSHEVALGAPGSAGIRVAIQYRNLIRALLPDPPVSQPGGKGE